MEEISQNLKIYSLDDEELPEKYVWQITRMTVDKLGVKMYDKASAVVAELIANAYDADAKHVLVKLPVGKDLTQKDSNGQLQDRDGYFIEIEDDGHGMAPAEAQEFYLHVGLNRRENPKQGAKSRELRRPVMGRKGIGKLAPFGICRKIEVWSAGGSKTPSGYRIAHFELDYDKIVDKGTGAAPVQPCSEDKLFSPKRGTRIRLTKFLSKRVPNMDVLKRQIAARFAGGIPDFKIEIENINSSGHCEEVTEDSIDLRPGTKIELESRPVVLNGVELPVTGWLGLSKESYKNEELTGVRIYARGKIVASTRDFEQPAGYTGEHTIRSYLVGVVRAEWLDSDDGEDLIRSDRQGIIWDSEYGVALRDWGTNLVRELGKASFPSRRKQAKDKFIKLSNIKERAAERYKDEEVVQAALDFADKIGAFASEDELDKDNMEYVDGLVEVILTVAPHKALIDAFQEFSRQTELGDITLESLQDLFGKARIAEMASYSRIAAERVEVIKRLKNLILSDARNESDFQRLIADAPWLIEPTWTVISKNQALKTFKDFFERWFKKRTGDTVSLAIDAVKHNDKRPDFTLVSVGQTLHIVEIKNADHKFDDADCSRLINYVEAFDDFFGGHKNLVSEFPNKYQITLVADGENLTVPANRLSFRSLIDNARVRRMPWADFLARAQQAHQMFLEASETASSYSKQSPIAFDAQT